MGLPEGDEKWIIKSDQGTVANLGGISRHENFSHFHFFWLDNRPGDSIRMCEDDNRNQYRIR